MMVRLSFVLHKCYKYSDNIAEEMGGIQVGQWVKVVINYGTELPTYYKMHVNDCYIVAGLKRLGLILNEEIPQVQRLIIASPNICRLFSIS